MMMMRQMSIRDGYTLRDLHVTCDDRRITISDEYHHSIDFSTDFLPHFIECLRELDYDLKINRPF